MIVKLEFRSFLFDFCSLFPTSNLLIFNWFDTAKLVVFFYLLILLCDYFLKLYQIFDYQ